MKIAIEGCAHGELEKIYDTIEGIEKDRSIKVDLLLCCGDFQSTRNLEDLQTMAVPRKYMDICSFYKYYSGERVAPVLTIFIGGNHEASNYLQELPYGGWVAPNIYYLGYAGVININGIRIAGVSGIYKGHDFLRGHHEFPPYTDSTCRSVYHVRQLEVFRLKQLSGNVDIFLSHDWPRGICEYGNKAQLLRIKPYFEADMANGQLGSRPLEELLKDVKPSYWFAAHLHCKFAALVPHHDLSAADTTEDADDVSSDSENEQSHKEPSKAGTETVAVTKFLALDKCLPKRRFLQVLDMPAVTEPIDGKLCLEYDAEWLAILLTTNHLISIKDNNYYLPGKKAGSNAERFNFTPTPDELALISKKFPSLKIPKNFCRTVPAYNPHEEPNYKNIHVAQPNAQLNPQCTEFCSALGIDDPLTLAMLANGKELHHASEIQDTNKDIEGENADNLIETSSASDAVSVDTFVKPKLNLSLPAPTATPHAEVDENAIELADDISETDETAPIVSEQPSNDNDAAKVEPDVQNVTNAISSNAKTFKRRNQSIYQAANEDE